jgi:alanine racemase
MDVEQSLQGRRPTWVEVRLRHLDSNLQWVRSLLTPNTRVMAVVKANAYGHGAAAVAERLEKAGIDHLAVAFSEEGLELRRHGIRSPILLLNGFWPGQEEEIVSNRLTPTVFSLSMVRSLAEVARRLGTTATYQIKIDTGLCRLGVDWQHALEFLKACSGEASTRCEGIYTHLSSSEEVDNPSTNAQIDRFQKTLETLKQNGFFLGWHHAANSAGILNFHDSWFDTVRPGLMLYGINPNQDRVESPLNPLLSFKTQIMQLKRVSPGISIGYGGAYTTTRASVIATLPVGYADGLNRLLSNRGSVLLRGQKVQIVGRISMDLTLIDVTDVPEASLGDEIVLIGRQGNLEISAEQIAQLTGTIAYEVLCGITQRVPRVHLQ